ncbi:uncharacterized protein F5147DRAFT_771265 [Suillus discolor]|uniref:Uncharacterized protein n=1 Tax=Suillus discolor TaxID=1912936 RepID=A0A9P7FCX8_9AGAM|nr:uncharacterized protein F5147DRAFT_771265 [Suillus discolor]KAG2112203.1 hypothetical protein F5147DRAFT_771265 [Suillus discolor]
MPPRRSLHNQLLDEIDTTTLEVVTALYNHIMQDDSDSDSDIIMNLSPPSPMSPYVSDTDTSSTANSSDSSDVITYYARLLGAINALRDEVEAADIYNPPNCPIPCCKE